MDKLPPDKNTVQQQQSRGRAAMSAQWYEDQVPESSSGRITTTENLRRSRENFETNGISSPSKSQKSNINYETELQNARAKLRPTSSSESSPRSGKSLHNLGHSPTRSMDTSSDSLGVQPQTADVTITTTVEGRNFHK